MKKRHIPLVLFATLTLLGSCSNPGEGLTSPTSQEQGLSIRFEKESLTLYVEDTYQLNVILSDENEDKSNVAFTSSDTSVATVSKAGLVTALKEGEITIKAIFNQQEEISATMKLVVVSRTSLLDRVSDTDVSFEHKKVNAFLYSKDKTQLIDLYYRKDRLSNIPYISIKEYYKLLLNKDLTVTKLEGSKYELVNPLNAKVTIDTAEDKLVANDYQKFISTTIYRQNDAYNTYYDGAPFVKIKETKFKETPKEKNISFKDYNINLFGRGEDIYLPLMTCSNLFQGPTMLTCFYDPNNVYFIDPNNPLYNTEAVFSNPDYNQAIQGFFKNGERDAYQANYSYNELCFFIDTYYGRPGRETIHDQLVANKTIDKTLAQTDEYTKRARVLLNSTKQEDFYAGLLVLHDYLSDAGHTVIAAGISLTLNTNETLNTKTFEVLDSFNYHYGEKAAKRNVDANYMKALQEEVGKNNIVNNAYKKLGDTLLYTFNAFDFNIHDWNAFYSGKQEMPKDMLGNFVRMLDEYKNDTSIKNVVLDLTNNGGGYGDLVVSLMSLMTDQAYIHYRDMIGDVEVTSYYEVDRNFDKVFDEKDKEVKYPYHFGILSSGYSFSCGNLLPAQAKENGLLLLGDQSGGGCCAVLDGCNAEGLYIRISSPVHLCAKDGTEIDRGVVPHVNLTTKQENSYTFEKFYNLSVLSEEMNKFYSGK